MEENRQGTVMGYPAIVVQPIHVTNIEITTTTAVAATTAHQNPGHPATEARRPPLTPMEKRVIDSIILVIVIGFSIFSIEQMFYSPKFEVDSVNVYPFNISNSHITANWSITFRVGNPNPAHDILFEDVKASIFYKEKHISTTMMGYILLNEKFEKNNTRTVQANISVASMDIESKIAEAMAADWSNGTVNFNANINIARAKIGDDNIRIPMSVSCQNVKVGFSSNTNKGTMLDGSRECNVEYVYLLNILCIVALVISIIGAFIRFSVLYRSCREGRKEETSENLQTSDV